MYAWKQQLYEGYYQWRIGKDPGDQFHPYLGGKRKQRKPAGKKQYRICKNKWQVTAESVTDIPVMQSLLFRCIMLVRERLGFSRFHFFICFSAFALSLKRTACAPSEKHIVFWKNSYYHDLNEGNWYNAFYRKIYRNGPHMRLIHFRKSECREKSIWAIF